MTSEAVFLQRRTGYYVVLVGMAIAALIGICTPGPYQSDDGFFYPQIARNILATGQSSFHTITTTNGYHPLWMVVCTAIAYFLPQASPDALFSAIVFVQMLLLGASLLVLVRLEASIGIPHSVISMAILGVFFLGKGSFFLLETYLALFFLIYVTLLYVRMLTDRNFTVSRLVWFSTMAGLMVLSRLDLVFCAMMMVGGLALRYRRSDVILKTLAVAMPAALLIGGYMVLNSYFLGSAIPISGMIKSSFPYPHLEIGWGRPYARWFCIIAIILALCLLHRKHSLRQSSLSTRTENILLELFVFNFGYLLYVLLFAPSELWYFIQQFLLIALTGNYFLERYSKQFPRLLLVAVALLVSANVTLAAVRKYVMVWPNTGSMELSFGYDQMGWVDQLTKLLPDYSKILVFDGAGRIAYYSNLKVFPADGLVNNPQYDTELSQAGTQGYLCQHGIEYVYAGIPSKEKPFTVFLRMERQGNDYVLALRAPLTQRLAEPLLLPSHTLIAQFSAFLEPKKEREFGVWKVPCPEPGAGVENNLRL